MIERQEWYLWLAMAAVLGLLYLLAPVLTPFIAAFLLAYVGSPLVAYFERHGLSRAATVSFLFAFSAIVLLTVALGVGPPVVERIRLFSDRLPIYLDRLQGQWQVLQAGSWAPQAAWAKQAFLNQWQDFGRWSAEVVSFATSSGMRVADWVLNLFLIPVLTFYLLRDWNVMIARIDAAIPEKNRMRVRLLATEIDRTLAGFLRGQLSVMIVMTVFYAIALGLIGLDLALPIALWCGFASFMPYVGFLSGLTFAAVAAALQFHGQMWPLGWVVLTFIIAHFLDSLFLTPRLVGHSIGLHPVLVIFAVLAGGRLFGFMGVLLALPVSAVLMVWWRHRASHAAD